MSHVTRVAKVLQRGRTANKGKGLTAAQVAKRAGIDRDAVYRAVYELRYEGTDVFRNSRVVNGSKKYYYRIAA